MDNKKEFDLNIGKVLENWETSHAIRELIANALDEQVLTNTEEIKIYKDKEERWHIRDYGRGLDYHHLTQNENPEKQANMNLIGKFGVGLKDAFATFDRKNIDIKIVSAHGIFTISHIPKAGFEDITTLHIAIKPPKDVHFKGTDCILAGCPDSAISDAKELFLKFSTIGLIETTKYGEIYQANKTPAIYINGIKVAEEPNFTFSYNITKPTATLRKALNRERTNVGRVAYTDRIKDILLASESNDVNKIILKELKGFASGLQKDELKWLDVQTKFLKHLNENEGVVFITASEYSGMTGRQREIINESEKEIVFIPENVMKRIEDSDDKITNINTVITEYMDSFCYDFVDPDSLSSSEFQNYKMTESVISRIFPEYNGEILISDQLRTTDDGTRGVCECGGRRIIILRDVLKSRKEYLGTLAHELIHAKTGYSDCSREFENALTDCVGDLLNKLL